MKKCFILAAMIPFVCVGCVATLIGGAVYHSSKTKGQRQEFMAEFQQTNMEREKQGLQPLDWCSEAYRFDVKYAKKDTNCAKRIKAYESGDTAALSQSTLTPVNEKNKKE